MSDDDKKKKVLYLLRDDKADLTALKLMMHQIEFEETYDLMQTKLVMGKIAIKEDDYDRSALMSRDVHRMSARLDEIQASINELKSASKPELSPAVNNQGDIIIYTDGACSGNPGPGGWGVIVMSDDNEVTRIFGGDPQTTNNRMEMRAMLEALRYAREHEGSVIIRSDSEYVIKGMTEWMEGWKKRGWRGSAGKPVQNADLWREIDEAQQSCSGFTVQHVKGHSGEPGNEACDALAVSQRDIAKSKTMPFYGSGSADDSGFSM